MEIKYKNERLKKCLEDTKYVSKAYGADTLNHFIKFKERIIVANDLYHFMRFNKGSDTMKFRGDEWKSRLNDKWRIHYISNGSLTEIEVLKIHPHKYKK